MNHDYCHCANHQCPLKQKCFRYQLTEEDMAGRGTGWCSYAGFKPEAVGDELKCEHFILREED